MFLGFMLGALAMRGHYTTEHRLAALAPAIIMGVPIFDTLYIMGVRALRGLPLMRGSPDHFAVRLRNNGLKAGAIAVVAYGCGAGLGLAALGMVFSPVKVAAAILGGVVLASAIAVLVLWRMGRNPNERPGRSKPAASLPVAPASDAATPPTRPSGGSSR